MSMACMFYNKGKNTPAESTCKAFCVDIMDNGVMDEV